MRPTVAAEDEASKLGSKQIFVKQYLVKWKGLSYLHCTWWFLEYHYLHFFSLNQILIHGTQICSVFKVILFAPFLLNLPLHVFEVLEFYILLTGFWGANRICCHLLDFQLNFPWRIPEKEFLKAYKTNSRLKTKVNNFHRQMASNNNAEDEYVAIRPEWTTVDRIIASR